MADAADIDGLSFELALADVQTGIDLEPEQDSAWFVRAAAYAVR